MSDKVMKTAVEVTGENQAEVTIEVTAKAFQAAVQEAYLKNRHKISLPGFRKGRVPRQMLEAQYGKNFFYEDALDFIFTEVYEVAIEEHKIDPVSRPSIKEMEEIKGGMRLVVETHTKPIVEAPDYKGLEHTKKDTQATEEEIMQVCKDNLEKNARVISVTDRPAANGDVVNINFEGFVDGEAFEGGKGEDYELVLGSGSFIPGFEEQIEGKNIGDDFDVNVSFPEEYHVEHLAGKASVFKTRLLDIKARELPELDDEFAQEVSEHDTLEEYKAEIKAKIEEAKTANANREIENELAIALSKLVTVNVPVSMIETEVSRMVNEFADSMRRQGLSFESYLQATGMTMQAVRAMYEEQADQVVRGRLAIEAIVKKENVEASDDELNVEFEKLAAMYNMEVEKFLEAVGTVGRENIVEDVKAQKAMELVKSVAVAVEKTEEKNADE